MTTENPFHIKILESALNDARKRVDDAADELVAFERANADILATHKKIRDRLNQAEVDRVGAEDAIYTLGYQVPPRS